MSGHPSSPSRARHLKRAGRSLFSTSIFANYFWSILNLALGKGLRLVAILLCVRRIGTESWGQAASTVALMALIGLLVSQGLNGLPQIFRVNDRELDRPMMFNICLYRLLMAAIVIAALFALHPVIPALTPLVLAYSFVLIPRALNIEWLFHRRERYQLAVLINAVKAGAFFSIIAAGVGPGSTAMAVIGAEIASEVCGLLFSLALLGRAGLHGSPRGGGSLPLRVLLVAALPVFFSEALHTLPTTVDILFLKAFRGYDIVARYDIGSRISIAYFFLGASLIQIVLPKLTRLHEQSATERMGRVLTASSGMLLFLGAALLILSLHFPREGARLLLGKEYPETILVFRWMPVWVYVSFITMLNTTVLLAMGKRRTYLWGALLATAVNVTANGLLIHGYGAAGAVAARVFAEIVFCVYAVVQLPAGIKRGYSAELSAQAGLLAGILALYLVSDWITRPVSVAASVAFCGVVLWRRGIFTRDTVAVLRAN
jgi:O-antigen/teichoic acid export membrane protein